MTTAAPCRVSAVVLAAGESLRMGETKQLLRMGGRTLLERTLECARNSDAVETILVLGHAAETIRRELPQSLLGGVTVVINPAYKRGMASSLREGLSAVAIDARAALIMLSDQPFVRGDTINRIIERYCASEAEIVIPYYKGRRGNPVLLGRPVFEEAMLLKGDIGCRAIFASHTDRTLELNVNDAGILLDIDDRADYERLRGLG